MGKKEKEYEANGGFFRWFHENSGYSLHRVSKKSFSTRECCGVQPQPTGRRILFQSPATGKGEPFLLCRCPNCGAYYVGWQGGWHKIDNLLKYPVVK